MTAEELSVCDLAKEAVARFCLFDDVFPDMRMQEKVVGDAWEDAAWTIGVRTALSKAARRRV